MDCHSRTRTCRNHLLMWLANQLITWIYYMHCTLTHEKHRSSQKSLICNPIEEGYFKRSEEVSPEVGGIAHDLRRCSCVYDVCWQLTPMCSQQSEEEICEELSSANLYTPPISRNYHFGILVRMKDTTLFVSSNGILFVKIYLKATFPQCLAFLWSLCHACICLWSFYHV